MGKIVRIQKTLQADAIKPTTPEEDAVVRIWFTEYFEAMGLDAEDARLNAEAVDLGDVKSSHMWIARDLGSKILYFIPPASFISDFEEVDETDIEPLEQDLKFLNDFKFEEPDSN